MIRIIGKNKRALASEKKPVCIMLETGLWHEMKRQAKKKYMTRPKYLEYLIVSKSMAEKVREEKITLDEADKKI